LKILLTDEALALICFYNIFTRLAFLQLNLYFGTFFGLLVSCLPHFGNKKWST